MAVHRGGVADIKREGGVLCVGLVCLDIVNSCDHYPREDEEVRVSDQKRRKGGNAANTVLVLRLLNQRRHCELLSTLGQGMEADCVLSELDELHIDYAHCRIYPAHRLPTSYILLNTSNGSRTIAHYRNLLPELDINDFQALDLSKYEWIHFEGRNPDQVVAMVAVIRGSSHCSPVVSIELEKEKPELAPLISLGDVLFVSKEYAGYHGYTSPEEACTKFRDKARKNAIIICAWAERGAAGSDTTGQICISDAFPPPGGLVDTLGAGDTFNAAVIHKLMGGATVKEAIVFGCRVAGAKCGMEGYIGLRQVNFE